MNWINCLKKAHDGENGGQVAQCTRWIPVVTGMGSMVCIVRPDPFDIQEAGQWTYSELQDRYQKYSKTEIELTEAHQEALGLKEPLDAKELNHKQHLIVIGSAADVASKII